ncbi:MULTISPECIES: hypothetical protein [Paenibacillus]|uniref:hypothetical protein n=1 Tax=Paenibacillus TaxID=44249 RepID=UPI000A90066D|nr:MULTISPECIES: hypothetical protein [Paenibacillus]
MGADGFRFDAAKHIELPNDPGGYNFWPRVLGSLNNKDKLFNYGEVLQGGADNFAGYANYLSLSASSYGGSVRFAIGYCLRMSAAMNARLTDRIKIAPGFWTSLREIG